MFKFIKYKVVCFIKGTEAYFYFDNKKQMCEYLKNVSGIEVLKIEKWKYQGVLKKWKM